MAIKKHWPAKRTLGWGVPTNHAMVERIAHVAILNLLRQLNRALRRAMWPKRPRRR